MKNNKREIPTKNYIIVLIMFVVSIAIVFGIRAWYRNSKELELKVSVISGKISEINISEFDAYLTAHDDFYLYIGTSYNNNCRNIEDELVTLLEKRNIKDETVYLNMSNVSKDKSLIIEKLAKMDYRTNTVNYPVFAIIKDGKISGIVNKKIGKVYVSDIEKILDEFEVGI